MIGSTWPSCRAAWPIPAAGRRVITLPSWPTRSASGSSLLSDWPASRAAGGCAGRCLSALRGAEGAAGKLSGLTGVHPEVCQTRIQEALLAGYRVVQPETRYPVFPFRLHQFISRGDTIYASLEDPEHDALSRRRDSSSCRETATGYSCRWPFAESAGKSTTRSCGTSTPRPVIISYRPRDVMDQSGEDDATVGFLYPDFVNPWPEDMSEVIERLPEDWLETYKGDAA